MIIWLGALIGLLVIIIFLIWLAIKLFRLFRNKFVRAVIVIICICLSAILLWAMAIASFGVLWGYCDYLKAKDYDKFYAKILPDVSWVQDDFVINFARDKNLYKIKVNGKALENIFKASSPIYGCEFSPNGDYFTISTIKDEIYLFNFNKESNQINLIGSLGYIGAPYKLYDVPSMKLLWAPDSKRFIFKILYSDDAGTQNNYYIYDCIAKEKKLISGVPRDILKLRWDTQGAPFYYVQEVSVSQANNRPVKVFRVDALSLLSQEVAEYSFNNIFSWDQITGHSLNLGYLGIKLFEQNRDLIIYRDSGRYCLDSETGSKLFIDDNGYVYYQGINEVKRDLHLKFPRGIKGHAYVRHLLWLPGGRYCIFNFNNEIIVMEPSTGKMGKLVNGDFFYWYQGGINKE